MDVINYINVAILYLGEPAETGEGGAGGAQPGQRVRLQLLPYVPQQQPPVDQLHNELSPIPFLLPNFGEVVINDIK